MVVLPLKPKKLKQIFVASVAIIGLVYSLENIPFEKLREVKLLGRNSHSHPTLGVYLPQLQMQGGNPYIRALMRTISASEANDPQPYSILYGGQRVSNLSRHPEQCITIVSGPNSGNCSTAAGRYQMLNITWKEKAQLYHPQPSRLIFWESYSFEPQKINRDGWG